MAEHSVDDVNINRTIRKLARYNYYVKGHTSNESYDDIVKYMQANCSDFTEVGSYHDIQGCIRDASKSPWKDITKVIITQAELEKIKSLDDIRKEKIAFVLLADAKYDNAYKNKKLNYSFLSNSDLYRLARVTMPVAERNMFLHFLYSDGLVEININPTSKGKKLLYVSESDEDVGLVLSENNYNELAFTYLNWKNGGYKECKKCGNLFKAKTSAQYCKKCSPVYKPIKTKTIVCIDCGTDVDISSKDNQTCRCERCYQTHRRQAVKENVQKCRNKNKM